MTIVLEVLTILYWVEFLLRCRKGHKIREEWTGRLVVYFNFKYFVPIANKFENGEFN